MKIFLFVTDEGKNDVEVEVAKRLDREFIFMVDAIHADDRLWLEKNFDPLPHQVYYGHRVFAGPGKHRYVAESIKEMDMRYTPLLVICFQEDDVIDQEVRDQLKSYFLNLLFDDGPEFVLGEKTKSLLERCKRNYQQPLEGSSVIGPEKVILVKGSDSYDFRYKLYPGFDICLAEITKPFVDRPYTVVLRNFEENGWRYLFSGIFYANSWGLCHEDLLFLRELWVKLEMKGECDLEGMLKEHTEKCTPGSKGEPIMCQPEVYRTTLEETVETLKRKKCHEIDRLEEDDEIDKMVKKAKCELEFE